MVATNLDRAYQRAYRDVRTAFLRESLLSFRALGSWNRPDADRFVRAYAPVHAAAMTSAGELAAGYFQAHGVANGIPLAEIVANVPANITTPRIGDLDVATVYERPFITMWGKLGAGVGFIAARQIAEQRLLRTADTDLQLARRRAEWGNVEGSGRIIGYERVLAGETCDFCAIAATNTYSTGDLDPLHAGCDCSVAPLYDTSPAPSIPSEEETRESMGISDEVQPIVFEHGEVGNYLGQAGVNYTTAGDL